MKGNCYYCERPFGEPQVGNTKALIRTKDHIIPVSHGGRNTPENYVYACVRCNGFKANRTPDEFAILIQGFIINPGRGKYGRKYLEKILENTRNLILQIAPYRDRLFKGYKGPPPLPQIPKVKFQKLAPEKVVPALADDWRKKFFEKWNKEPDPDFHEK